MNSAGKLKIYALGHLDEQLAAVPQGHAVLQAVDLRQLAIAEEFRGNQLCENKIYLDQRFESPETEYVGFVSASWDAKWCDIKGTRLIELAAIDPLESDLVWIAAPTTDKWMDYADHHQPGIKALMLELGRTFSLNLARSSFWCNSFICHHTVFRRFLATWRMIFSHYHTKYGFQIPFNNDRYPADRHAAYFYERVTTAIFSDMPDIRFRLID